MAIITALLARNNYRFPLPAQRWQYLISYSAWHGTTKRGETTAVGVCGPRLPSKIITYFVVAQFISIFRTRFIGKVSRRWDAKRPTRTPPSGKHKPRCVVMMALKYCQHIFIHVFHRVRGNLLSRGWYSTELPEVLSTTQKYLAFIIV